MNHLFYLLSDPMLIVEFDQSRWNIRDVNKAFSIFSGFKKSDLIQLDPSTLIMTLEAEISFLETINRLSDEQSISPVLECSLITKASTPADVRMSCRKLVQGDQALYVIILKDIREEKWIDEYITHHKIMASSILNERFNIMALKHYYAPIQQPASSYINHSILDLVAEQDQSKLKRVLDFAKNNRTAECVDFHLSFGDRYYNTEALIQPFYNGNRSFKAFVLILTNLHLNTQEEDPSYKLRMLMLSKNISVTSLAQSTLISLTTISKIRNGKIKKPQRLTAELIAGELGVRPESIWSSFKH